MNGGTLCGSEDYISISEDSIDGEAQFTTCMWFNKDTNVGVDALVGAVGDGAGKHGYMATNADRLWFRWVINSDEMVAITGTTSLTTGLWYHACFWYDGTNTRIYVNGNSTADAEGADSGSVTINGAMHIGGHPAAGNDYDGKMDEVRFFNKALSVSEMQDLYNNSIAGRVLNLVIEGVVVDTDSPTFSNAKNDTTSYRYLNSTFNITITDDTAVEFPFT